MSSYRALTDKELLAVMELLNVAGLDGDDIPFTIGEAEAQAETKGAPTIYEFLPVFMEKPTHPRPENVECMEHHRRVRLFKHPKR